MPSITAYPLNKYYLCTDCTYSIMNKLYCIYIYCIESEHKEGQVNGLYLQLLQKLSTLDNVYFFYLDASTLEKEWKIKC